MLDQRDRPENKPDLCRAALHRPGSEDDPDAGDAALF